MSGAQRASRAAIIVFAAAAVGFLYVSIGAEPVAGAASAAPPSAALPLLSGLQMFGATDGWAVSATGGQLLVTHDGGALWTPSDSGGAHVVPMPNNQGTNPVSWSIGMMQPGASYAPPGCTGAACRVLWVEGEVGNDGAVHLFQSTNGGLSWTDLHQVGLPAFPGVASMEPLWEAPPDLSFPTAMDSWAVWYATTPDVEEIVFHSDTTGRRWAEVGLLTMTRGLEGSPPPAGVPARLAFATPSTGWFVGTSYGFAWLYATADGGHTWRNVELAIPPAYLGYQVTTNVPVVSADGRGVLPVTFTRQVVGPGAFRQEAAVLLYRTTDGGATWTATTPVAAYASGPTVLWSAPDPQDAWVLGGPQSIEVTADGGATWQAVRADTSLARAVVLDVAPVQRPATAAATTASGTQAAPVAPDQAWALVNNETGAALLHTADGGAHWTTIAASVQ